MNADDIPTEITKLVYTAPRIYDPTRREFRPSSNDTARFLAHFWPAIEQHVREQVARDLAGHAQARIEQIDESDLKPSDQARYQEWLDAAQVARGAEVAW